MIRSHATRQNIANLIQVNRYVKASLIQHWFRSHVSQQLYKIYLKKKQEQKNMIIDCTSRILQATRRNLANMRYSDLGRSKRIRNIVSLKLAKLMTNNDSSHTIRNQLVFIARLVMPCQARWKAVYAIRIHKCLRGRHGRDDTCTHQTPAIDQTLTDRGLLWVCSSGIILLSCPPFF